MSPRATYGEETKAAAMAALLAGGRVREVARDFGVPEGTAKSWRHRLKNGRVATLKKGSSAGCCWNTSTPCCAP